MTTNTIPWGDPRSIWPEPKSHCGLKEGDRVTVIGSGFHRDAVVSRLLSKSVVVRGLDPNGRLVEVAYYPESLRRDSSEDERRTRGIALGHVRARARMRRALAWIDGHWACGSGRAFAARHLSPEACVFAAATSSSEDRRFYVVWLAFVMRLGDRWRLRASMFSDCGTASERLAWARAILASPEWASLPWQEGPGGGR